MTVSSTIANTVARAIDCSGLSAAPTVLRIKQALTGLSDEHLPLGVLLDSACDRDRIAQSLGAMAGDVHLATEALR
jgi:hypothetical protein